jgi:tetratricopeptide (TPR) repeat protein
MVALREQAILVAAVVAAFGASLAGPFHLDDFSIFSDPALTSPGGWWDLWRPVQTRPLTWLTFWINYRLGGSHPAGYHAVNLALHLGAVLVALSVLGRLLDRRAALIAAAIFAVHPIQAEAVNYVFARAILLATLLCLAAADAWLRGRPWLAVAWFAAALAAKEECAAFPVALVLLGLAAVRSWPVVVMLVLALAAGLRVIWAASVVAGAGSGAGSAVAAWDYLAAQGGVILRYLRLLVAPYGFTVDPQVRSFPVAWIAVLALVLVAVLRRDRWFLAGLVLLVPSSSVFPASDLAADRRMYLPLVILAAAPALLLRRVRLRWLAAAGLLLAGLSAHRTWVWSSEERLWSEAVARAPAKTRPRLQLARSVGPVRGEKLLQEAAALVPEDPAVPAELGRLHLESGRPELALADFGRALALAPNDPRALNNRGTALAALGQREAARADFERALDRDPCLFEARSNLRRLGVERPAPPGCRYTPDQARALSAPPGP